MGRQGRGFAQKQVHHHEPPGRKLARFESLHFAAGKRFQQLVL
jgi:hypothetical protein